MQDVASVATENYSILMTAVVKKMIVVMGKEKALKLAGRVSGVTVEPDGQVSSPTGLEDLRQLVREYRTAGGTVTLYLIKGAIAPLIKGSNVPLPDELR